MELETPTLWSPVLSSARDLQSLAWEAIDAISLSVSHRRSSSDLDSSWQRLGCEEALLYGYLARIRNDDQLTDQAIERMNGAIDSARSLTYCGLYGGLCGLGWTIEHLVEFLSQSDEGETDDSEGRPAEKRIDLNADIDTLLLRELQKGRWRGPYDLIGGLVGFGVYFLQRLPAETAVLGIQLIIYHLEQLAEQSGTHITWHTPPQLLPASQVGLWPHGYHNLGVAHGVPGVIHFLNAACAMGIENERANRLLEGAVSWLIAQQRPADPYSRFGSWVASGESPGSRLAWCYGDLGITSVLLQISRRVQRPEWLSLAQDLLERCLAWPFEKSGVVDAQLCHGAAGVAHIFNRIYQRDGDDRCRQASLIWYERALLMRQPGVGIGGYFAFKQSDPSHPAGLEADPSFLDGAIGIGLAFLAALTPIEPVWDRMLLLSSREPVSKLS